MLYPDFNELVAFKDRKLDLIHPSHRSVKSIAAGNHHSPFRGQGLEFDSVREYVPGDDIRNIDWRVTARTNKPHLKLFKEERERHILICVDMNASMRFGTKNTFKSVQAAHAAAMLGWRGIAQQNRVSGCLFGDVPKGILFFAPQRTRKSFCTLLKTLAEPVTEKHTISFKNILQPICQSVHTGSLIYFISDFLDIDKNFHQEIGINHLNKKCDIVFLAINDAADKAIFPIGRLGFRFNDSEKLYVNTNSFTGRQAYAAQWEENRKNLYETTYKLKIPIIELSTESDISRDLFFALKTIGKRKKR